MSDGPRIKLDDALKMAAGFIDRLGVAGGAVQVVGSVRRRTETVGDLDLVAPLPPAGKPGVSDDPLYRVLLARADRRGAGLFDASGTKHWVAVSGVKCGFREALLLLTFNQWFELPCQIYRYTPANAGWITLIRTGPEGFGARFLTQWKRTWGITEQASVNGHLVDKAGRVVPVATEREAFALCGMKWVEPEDRE